MMALHDPLPTTPERERRELARWRLRPGSTYGAWFAALIDSEFAPPERLRREQDERLREVVHFAFEQVPYYRQRYGALGIEPGDLTGQSALPHLPILSKLEVIEHAAELRARRLPDGMRVFGTFMSSGTTGRPVAVEMSDRGNLMYSILAQRSLRWARVDPGGVYCAIRIPSHFPRRDDRPLANGELAHSSHWHYVGGFFETGPAYGFSVWNPPEQQLAWLAAIRPDYLASYPGTLEELAFANAGASPAASIAALFSAGSSMAPATRRQVERLYQAPLHDAYGLNEIGRVAVRCAAGAYHVHAEHCIVEIVDAKGRPCAPGTLGRVVVTALQNLAMPLLRYDTGDVARALDLPCACGRRLPVIGEIAGRFRRFGYLPPGTRTRHYTLFDAIEALPVALLRPLRQYQLHQCRDHSFILRIRSAGGMAPEFAERLSAAWAGIDGAARTPLRFEEVEAITASPSGKQLEFDSDFYPDPEIEVDPRDHLAALARLDQADD